MIFSSAPLLGRPSRPWTVKYKPLYKTVKNETSSDDTKTPARTCSKTAAGTSGKTSTTPDGKTSEGTRKRVK